MVGQKRMGLEANRTDNLEQEKETEQVQHVQKKPMLTRVNSGYWGLGKPVSNYEEFIDIRGNQCAESVNIRNQTNNTPNASQISATSADLVNSDNNDDETALTPKFMAEQSNFSSALEIVLKFNNIIISAFRNQMFASWIMYADPNNQAIVDHLHKQLAPLLTTPAIKNEFKLAIKEIEKDSQKLTKFFKRYPAIAATIAKTDITKLEGLTLAWFQRQSRFRDYHVSNLSKASEYIMQPSTFKNPIFGKVLPTRNHLAAEQTVNTLQQSGLAPQ